MTESVPTEQIARLRITLEGIEPAVWRQIEVPLTATLKALHHVIQAAFGWEGYHLHLFQVGEERYGVPDPEWDSVRPIRSEKTMRLITLIERGIERFGYSYDFGDDWRHEIAVEGVGAADQAAEYPQFVSGARRVPLRMSAACRAMRSLFARSPAHAIGNIGQC